MCPTNHEFFYNFVRNFKRMYHGFLSDCKEISQQLQNVLENSNVLTKCFNDNGVIRKVTLDLKYQQRILLYYTLMSSLQIVKGCGRSWWFIIIRCVRGV
jgi:hypothetical protein